MNVNGNGARRDEKRAQPVAYRLGKFVGGVASFLVLTVVAALAAFLVGAVWAFAVRGFHATCDWIGC